MSVSLAQGRNFCKVYGMKVVKERTVPTIALADIDPKKHIIVGIIEGRPCIGHQDWGVADKFRFYPLDNQFTKGNHYLLRGKVSTVVKNCIDRGDEIMVFEDYKEALQYLVDYNK